MVRTRIRNMTEMKKNRLEIMIQVFRFRVARMMFTPVPL